jgi:anaerobic selenocysteine-containing dehydrogenase
LLLGVIPTLINEDRFDHDFVKSWSNGPFLVDVATGRFLRGNDPECENSEPGELYVAWDRTSQTPRAVDTVLHSERWGLDLLGPTQLGKRVGLAKRPLGAARVSAQAHNVYRAVLEGDPYPIRGLVAFDANLLLQNADGGQGRDALEKLDFHLHVDMFEDPSSQFADNLLPAATCWESPALATSCEGGPQILPHISNIAYPISPASNRTNLRVPP